MAKEKETERLLTSGASSKSRQPLHNFMFPRLKWGTNRTNLQRFHKHSGSARTGSPQRVSPSRLSSPSNDEGSRMVNEGVPVALSFPFPAASDHDFARSEKNTSGERGRIVPRLHTKKDRSNNAVAGRTGDWNLNSVKDVDKTPKIWNLRPRKVEFKKSVGNVTADRGVSRIGGLVLRAIQGKSSQTESTVSRTGPKGTMNTKFSITLTKAEIEADIIAMTGSNPSRKPRKRAKTLQKKLNISFPGLRLDTITPSSYKVSHKLKKGRS